MSLRSDLESLHLAFRAIHANPRLAPALGELIAEVGAQLHPTGRSEIGEFSIGAVTYRVDLSDRFGRACVYGGRQERDDLDLFLGLCDEGAVVWDIGANFGLYALVAAERVGPGGAVMAVEPSPRARALLEGNVNRNPLGAPIRILPFAVAGRDGRAAFHDAVETAFSGLSDTHRSTIASVIEVDVRRLDTLWRETGERPIDLLKIDVEGHEGDVLAGGSDAIAASPNLVVQFEASPKNLDESRRENLSSTLRSLQDKGMAVWHLAGGGAVTRLPPLDALPSEAAGNLFMVRAGSGRERRFVDVAERIANRPPAPLSDLESALIRALDLVNTRHKARLAKLLKTQNAPHPPPAESHAPRPPLPPPLGRSLRPFALAAVKDVSAVVRVTADGHDLEAALAQVRGIAGDRLRAVVFADARRRADQPLAVPAEAGLVSPPLSAGHRYSAAVLASLRAIETGHLLLVDAGTSLGGSLDPVIARWKEAASRGESIAGMAFCFAEAEAEAEPTHETTLGGMLALRHGLLAVAPLRRLSIAADLYDGDAFDLDLSLRLWHAGFGLAEAPAVTVRLAEARPTRVPEDAARLEKEWTGIFTHPLLPELFKKGISRRSSSE